MNEHDTPMGRRRVKGALGSGAVTATLAVQGDGEPVRIGKRLLSRFSADHDARAMLGREAAILACLAGRGAPRLVDQGSDARGPYLVMELCAMSRLATHGARSPKPRQEWWAVATRAALGALALVHDATDARGPLGVVHGDVSPGNVLVSDDAREARIVDFGLAHFRDDPGPPRGPFRGTLLFAAPEVARGEAPDARSDLFSLASSLLAGASGRAPREQPGFASLLAEAAEAPIDAFARLSSADLDRRVADVLCACVRFDPNERPARAQSALAQL